MSENKNQYDSKTLATAAAIFIGFALLIFFLPNIMQAVGGENRILAGAIVVGVLVLPFVGLWLRGRIRRKGE
ncbi:hypothetical protein [Oricola indica]|uniref:hypothetical protein n=1 Tax=Oricola indica TaxID=2872591 RepID=UPI003CCBDDAD